MGKDEFPPPFASKDFGDDFVDHGMEGGGVVGLSEVIAEQQGRRLMNSNHIIYCLKDNDGAEQNQYKIYINGSLRDVETQLHLRFRGAISHFAREHQFQ